MKTILAKKGKQELKVMVYLPKKFIQIEIRMSHNEEILETAAKKEDQLEIVVSNKNIFLSKI